MLTSFLLFVTFCGLAIKSEKKYIEPRELLQKQACRYLQTTPLNATIAVNKHDLDGKFKFGEPYNRYFNCSATSERQILIEGYEYLPKTADNDLIISHLVKLNQAAFVENNWEGIDYKVDFKNEIKGQTPEKVFSISDQTISIYKNPNAPN